MDSNELTNEKDRYKHINAIMLGRIIKGIRKSKQMTLEQLSNDSGIEIAHLSRIENGKALIRFETLSAVFWAFDLTIKEGYDCADKYLD